MRSASTGSNHGPTSPSLEHSLSYQQNNGASATRSHARSSDQSRSPQHAPTFRTTPSQHTRAQTHSPNSPHSPLSSSAQSRLRSAKNGDTSHKSPGHAHSHSSAAAFNTEPPHLELGTVPGSRKGSTSQSQSYSQSQSQSQSGTINSVNRSIPRSRTEPEADKAKEDSSHIQRAHSDQVPSSKHGAGVGYKSSNNNSSCGPAYMSDDPKVRESVAPEDKSPRMRAAHSTNVVVVNGSSNSSSAAVTPRSDHSSAHSSRSSSRRAHGHRGSERGSATPTAREKKKKALKPHDFEQGRMLGKGAYARVVFARCLLPNPPAQVVKRGGDFVTNDFALKIVDKQHLLRYQKAHTIVMEKTIMFAVQHPNIVKLYSTFQDAHSLYLLLELVTKGELFQLIQDYEKLPMKLAKFYTGEIVVALEYLHSKGVVHRDLKPENILIADDGHIKITDFGTAKILPGSPIELPPASSRSKSGGGAGGAGGGRGGRKSFVGTADYVSPEVLTDKPAGQPSDVWALGCILYQMLCGKTPFHRGSEYLIFQAILARELEFPADFDPLARELVEKLLVLEPDDRLSLADVKAHAFFEGVDFARLWKTPVPDIPPPKKKQDIEEDNGPTSDDSSGDEFESSGFGHAAPLDNKNLLGIGRDIAETRSLGIVAGARMLRKSKTSPEHEHKVASPLTSAFNGNPAQLQRAESDTTIASDGPSFARKAKPKHNTLSDPFSSADAKQDSPSSKKAETTKWSKFLSDNENLVFSGLVEKRGKRTIWSQKRQLLLTDFPRFLYINPQTMEVRGEIRWFESLRATRKEPEEQWFSVHTPTRIYRIKSLSTSARTWVDQINAIVAERRRALEASEKSLKK